MAIMSPKSGRPLSSAVDRWAGLGPYYAMFPVSFAFDVVREYSGPDGRVLDPFAGRASSIFAAAATGRYGLGIEINPVGWLYGRVKLAPAPADQVLERLALVHSEAHSLPMAELADLPEFFHMCYSPRVLQFLVTARHCLRWRHSGVDATLMAILLVYLHGKREFSLSNQLRQGKAMSPDYAVRWWRNRGLQPPDVDPVAFISSRIRWRFAKGRPEIALAEVAQGDCLSVLETLSKRGSTNGFSLLFTSPPYYAVTNYRYDQWLRLWLLGWPNRPERWGGPWEAKFESQADYQVLLQTAFQRAALLMKKDAVIYVRTDARKFTLESTVAALTSAFPEKAMTVESRPLARASQTALFGDKSSKPGEVDVILR